jgi:hypothetical protein
VSAGCCIRCIAGADAGAFAAAHSSSALLQAPQVPQGGAAAPEGAETEDALEAAGAAYAVDAAGDALAADSLSQHI